MDYYKWDELDSNVMLNGGKNSKDVEEALYKIINIALKQGKLKDRKASQIYSRYLNKLQSMSNTEFRVKLLAKKIIPDDEAYASKSNAIYRWHPYEMATEIDKLFILLKDISKEAIKGSTNQIYQHAKWKQREKALRAKHVNYETECAKYARLKKKDKNLRANHAKLKQRFRLLEQQVNQPLANMATLEHVMLALAPLVAQIPLYTGQEPPDAYIDKMEQLFTYGTALNVAGFNAAVKTDILKSKIHDNVQTQIMPVIQPAMPITQPVTNPTQNIINSNQQVIDQLKSLIMQNKAVKIRDPIAPPPIFQSPQQYKEDRWLYDMGLVDDETWKRFYPNEPFQRFCPKTEKAKKYAEMKEYAERGLEIEDKRPDDPMEIDYTLINLARELQGADMKEFKKVLEYLITVVKNQSTVNASLNEQQPVENASNIQPAIENVSEPMVFNILRKPASDIVTIKCRINKLTIPNRNKPASLEGVATESDTIGWVYNIPISIGFFTLLTDFIIVDENKPALLLGTPWLDKARAMIDFESRLLYIRNSNDLIFNMLNPEIFSRSKMFGMWKGFHIPFSIKAPLECKYKMYRTKVDLVTCYVGFKKVNCNLSPGFQFSMCSDKTLNQLGFKIDRPISSEDREMQQRLLDELQIYTTRIVIDMLDCWVRTVLHIKSLSGYKNKWLHIPVIVIYQDYTETDSDSDTTSTSSSDLEYKHHISIDESVSDFYIFYSDKVIDPLSPRDLGFLMRMFCVKLLHRRVGDQIHSNLTLALCVYSVKLSVKDLDYKPLGEQLEPNKDIVAINSNFIHKAYEGFDEFIARPKKLTAKQKKLKTMPLFKERKKVGDGTCFQSCLDIVILIDSKHYKMRYFPKSGDLQVFGVVDKDYRSGELAIQTFIMYLKESNGLTMFETVEIIKSSLSLLNFKYHMLLPSNLRIDVSKLDSILASDLYPPPFKIVYKVDPIDSIRKLSIVFESNGKKTRVIIWPSGKINIMSAISYDDALKIYNFLGEIFESEATNLLAIVPTSDSYPPQPKTPGKRGRKKRWNNNYAD
ncbi:5063_t:CDS:10 [Entrophospora sp. SA101]|nr:5063_t:CDS:10 [Entrophospora sp. SA101]